MSAATCVDDKQHRCTLTIVEVRHSRLVIHLAYTVKKTTIPVLPSQSLGRPDTKSILMDSQHPVGTNKLASGAVECEEGFWLTCFTCMYLWAQPFVYFWPPILLTHRVVSFFPAQIPTESSIMCLKEDTLIPILTHDDTSRICYIRA